MMEIQSASKDSVHSNFEVLETIHLRYLDEIRNLNNNLSSFKLDKENEVKILNEKLNQTMIKLAKS
jgi:hypothetical protein